MNVPTKAMATLSSSIRTRDERDKAGRAAAVDLVSSDEEEDDGLRQQVLLRGESDERVRVVETMRPPRRRRSRRGARYSWMILFKARRPWPVRRVDPPRVRRSVCLSCSATPASTESAIRAAFSACFF